MSSRRSELAKIHIAAKQLGMDPGDKRQDSDYRTMLWTAARVRSSADLDEHGRLAVIEHLRKCGAKFARPKKHQRPHNYNRLPEYVTKVEALLADMKLPWSYADTLARNITGGNGGEDKDPGVERLAWVKEEKHWRAIITALTVEHEKRCLLDAVDQRLASLRKDRGYLESVIAEAGYQVKGWERRRSLLRALVEYLNDQVPVQI